MTHPSNFFAFLLDDVQYIFEKPEGYLSLDLYSLLMPLLTLRDMIVPGP